MPPTVAQRPSISFGKRQPEKYRSHLSRLSKFRPLEPHHTWQKWGSVLAIVVQIQARMNPQILHQT